MNIVSINILGFFIFIFVIINLVFSQDEEEILTLDEDIVVTASRIPTSFPNVARTVIVIDEQQIADSPAKSIDELLQYASGIDVQQRGPQGVQSDINIRGATFEQSLVLIDGVKMNDPQTGHHNLDLPITLNDIKKIEILKGQGSRLYGPNAFGGVINIITKQATTREVSLVAIGGMFNLYDLAISASLPTQSGGQRLSISKKASDGYRENTDFDILTASYSGLYKLSDYQLKLFAGQTNKKFGANSFYHPSFPNQWERTKTSSIQTGLAGEHGPLSFSMNTFWRYHTDEFKLDRNRPEFYQNKHFTNVYGFSGQTQWVNRFGISSIGMEVTWEEINSNNLGNHQRNNYGFFAEHQVVFKKLYIILGSSFYRYENWGWRAWPGVDIKYHLTDKLSIYSSTGFAFRVPTFTELYYSDAANQGNDNLQAEQAWNYELGVQYSKSDTRLSFALFRREGKNLIDWVWLNSDSLWQARNLTRVNTNGLEVDFKYRNNFLKKALDINSINMSYTYLYSEKDVNGFTSKYGLTHLNHQAIVGVNQNLIFRGFKYNVSFRFEDRNGYGNRYLLDGKLKWETNNLELFIQGTNLLNQSYEDHHFIPLPGRWFKAGINYKLFTSD